MKLPVDTFDAWITKQVRASKKERAIISAARVELVLPKDTFELWIEKQKPKESVPPKLDTEAPPDTFEHWIEKQKPKENLPARLDTSAPDTFELWMSKQVALRTTTEASQEAAPEEGPKQTSPA